MTGHDTIEHASLTDVGLRRSHNQDSHAVLLAGDDEEFQKRGHVFMVADGMGAHAVGELASELAASIIPHTYHKHAEEGTAPAIRRAFLEANTSIHERGQQNREFQGMGTTGSILLIRTDGAWVGHVGDSRVYRIRAGHIEQLSFDHSLSWELAKRKGVRPETLAGVPSNVIVRSLGPEAQVQVDVEGPHPLRTGDIFVVCSDGLSGPLSDHEIGAVAGVLPPAEACQFLVALANLRGGPDNITVLVIRVSEDTDGASPAEVEPIRQSSGFRWLTWPLISLLLGLILAAAAVNLSASQSPIGKPAFLLAVLCLLVGIGGLGFQALRERRRPASGDRPRLKVYRHTSCGIERSLVDKLIKLEAALVQAAREKQPETDWDTHQEHHREAERLLAEGDLVGAFREYCRAMLPLTEAIHRLHNKAEVFQPIWEKKTKG